MNNKDKSIPVLLALVMAFVFAICHSANGDILISKGSVWKYSDTGQDLGTSWLATGYDDSAWPSGAAQLGYGDGDEATVISYGSDPNNKYPCYYFRHNFQVNNPSQYIALTLQVLRDDGCVVYLNGVEVARDNMPGGTINYGTWASSAIDDTSYHQFAADPALLLGGANVLAVEVHQGNATSSDISFDLELSGTIPGQVQIIKGPYLQKVTPNSIVVMWETDVAANGRVDYGIAAPGEYSVEDPALTTIHEIELSGLAAVTTYIYTVSSGITTSPQSTLLTAPDAAQPFRFVVYGDTRTNPGDHAAVVQSIMLNAPKPALVLHVGDCVESGQVYDQWDSQFFSPAHDLMLDTPLFPVLGNHEYSGTGQMWYFDFFALPGNEEWYAFSYGGTRFIGLNTCVAFDPASGQYQWLQTELSSPECQSADWRFVFFHHPPYSSSDRENGSINIDVRNYLVPLFETYGVNVVFSGHDHNYRHSIKSGIHYIISGGGGAPLLGVGAPGSYAPLIYAESVLEHCVIDVDSTSISCWALRNDGSVLDSFSLPDATPPVISNVSAADITETSARISWTTDELADSLVEYGLDLNYGSSVSDAAYVIQHSITLVNLQPETTYHYRVTSSDSFGNLSSTVEDYYFTTLTPNYDAYASQNPTVTDGVLAGSIDATHTLDGQAQTITEGRSGAGAALQAEYLLHTSANPAQVVTMTLYLEAQWTNSDNNDLLHVYIWSLGAWQEITADIQNGVFVPANPQDCIDAGGNIRVLFTDGGVFKKEKRDILSIDLLYAHVSLQNESPTAPAGLVAAAGNTIVNLQWDMNSEPDLAGYNVYRSTVSGGPYSLCNAALIANNSYADTDVQNDITYYYVVTAVDDAGFESAPSSEVSATPGVQPVQTVHVESITMGVNLAGRKYVAEATVWVQNNQGNNAVGAAVIGDWYLADRLIETSATALTGASGNATLSSPAKPAKSGDVFMFVVTDIVLSGFTYDPAANVETQDSIAVP